MVASRQKLASAAPRRHYLPVVLVRCLGPNAERSAMKEVPVDVGARSNESIRQVFSMVSNNMDCVNRIFVKFVPNRMLTIDEIAKAAAGV